MAPDTANVSVLCVGIAVMDQVYEVDPMPTRPAKHFARNYLEVGGGPAANAAVTVARLGGRAVLWARVGDDDLGRRILDELAGEGVDVAPVRRVPGARSGVSAVLVDRRGERLIVNYADPALGSDPSFLPLDKVRDMNAVLGDMRWPEGSGACLAAARAAGVPAVLDADTVPDDASPAPFAAASHILFSGPALARFADAQGIEPGLRRAARETGAWVAVTAGADGAYWLDDGTLRHQPAVPVATVDTVGAGDVFHGAFALALARRQPVADGMRFAAAAAALKCTRPGGRRGIPTRPALDRFLKEHAA
ncbi:MAG: PfkB family carbohydrate kinase [Inquilinaceae bacterium]